MRKKLKKVIILGINSMIGKNIAGFLVKDNVEIFGTYRKKNSDLLSLDKKVKTFKCDLTKKNDLKNLKRKLQSLNFKWDLIFSAVGTTEHGCSSCFARLAYPALDACGRVLHTGWPP